ncbi:MAG: holo-ACP synthase [Victivallales bacterium]|nr:holo-ACP synthase [Victivallales bacterium]
MIIATGIDIIEIKRLASSVQQYGEHFLNRVYTKEEQMAAPTSEHVRICYYAGRWAVKEAVSKALGTGIGPSCAMTDIVVLNDAAGRPHLELRGHAAETANRLGIHKIHISISHEREYAVAHAIAEN